VLAEEDLILDLGDRVASGNSSERRERARRPLGVLGGGGLCGAEVGCASNGERGGNFVHDGVTSDLVASPLSGMTALAELVCFAFAVAGDGKSLGVALEMSSKLCEPRIHS